MWRRSLSSSAVEARRRCTPEARRLSSYSASDASGASAASDASDASDASAASAASASSAAVVNSLILRSLKEHYLEISKMSPPPKVNPPAPYTVVKGALDRDGPALRREYKGEEVTISVMRLVNIMPGGVETDDDDSNEAINQLFLHVDISKPGPEDSLHFLCGLYPDAVGIHSVCLRPKNGSLSLGSLTKYQGRVFQELDDKLRDAFHMFIEARGVNESLFRFLQAWLYVKDHRNLMGWFKSVGTFISEQKKS